MKQPIKNGASIAIVGAGIIGVTSALELARRGYDVTVFDPFPPGLGGPSRRNAGHIAGSDIQPLATPGILLEGMKMLLREDSPLRIPGVEKLRLAPWFWRFFQATRGQRFQDACAALIYLSERSIPAMQDMLQRAGIGNKMALTGGGFVYDSETSFAASQKNWQKKAAAGFESHPATSANLAAMIPALNPKFSHAMISQNWALVSDPLEITQGIASTAAQSGVTFYDSAVSSLQLYTDGVTVETITGPQQFDAVVIAAGARSRSFARQVGDTLPMVAERGYNLTFPTPNITLDLPLIFADRGIAVTQLNEGLRIGGWAEYAASPDRPANISFYADLARISSKLFPDLCQNNAIKWMGNRPSLPDSVPVISRSSKSSRVFYNCGHGHYGLSFSAISADIIANVIGKENPTKPFFSVSRF